MTLSELTASLVDGHDADSVLRLVTSACERLLGAEAIGVVLTDPRGGLSVMAASDERTRFLELLQQQNDEGPCVECVHTGVPVDCPDLEADPRWPSFRPAALNAGFRAIHAVPLRLGGRGVGAVNLFFADRTEWEPWKQRLSQVLADLGVVGLSQDRDPARTHRLVTQTLTTLNDRVLLAHAVGMVAGALDLGTDEARALIASYVRLAGSTTKTVAQGLTSGELAAEELLKA